MSTQHLPPPDLAPPPGAQADIPVGAAIPTWRKLALTPILALIGGGILWLLLMLLAPEPLRPTDPVRAAEALAMTAHKQAVVLSLLVVPLAVLCAVLAGPWVASVDGNTPARPPQRAAWWVLGWRTAAALACAITLSLALAVWDFNHPTLTAAGWRSIHGRLGLLTALACLTTVWLQFAVERGLQLFRRLRRWEPQAAYRSSGLATVAALIAYGMCMSTTFISRPWIAARVPDEALVTEHLARYTQAVAQQQGAAAVAGPTFDADARLQVRAALRAALNAEAVNLTAAINPLMLSTAIWWYHDDGPAGRRVDLRTGAISYYQWVGSDSRITLPDFWQAAADPRGDAEDPSHVQDGGGDVAARFDPTGAGSGTSETDGDSRSSGASDNHAGPLAGIPIRTGLIGGLAGYGDWGVGPFRLNKDDGAPLAILLALVTGFLAVALNGVGHSLKS